MAHLISLFFLLIHALISSPGYYGAVCSSTVNFCENNPCFNGGGCTSQLSGPVCNCGSKYQQYFSQLFMTAYWEILHAFLSSADFLFIYQNYLFPKILSGIPSECQTAWIQIRQDILSGLIWVQTVCKDYQQRTLVGKEFRLK